MPRVTGQDKQFIFDSFVSTPGQLLQAFPNPVLFWPEGKPVEFLEELLLDFDVRGVFALSPGCGFLAEAASRFGICYAGATVEAIHDK